MDILINSMSNYASRLVLFLKIFLTSLAGVIAVLVLLIVFPEPMFKYRRVYQRYQLWSDRPIPTAIEQVLDDVTRRQRTSVLHDPRIPVKIFFCNEAWRMWLYGMHFSTKFGGVADVWLTRHVIIRESDIAANRILPPGRGPLADASQRPLSYFIAHEITHADESRRFGRTMILRYPEWLLEGYADYVGKGGEFDFDANRRQFIAGARELDHARSRLYRGYHLRVAYLLDKKGWTLEQLFDHPPGENQLDAWLRAW